ncbi:MAG TPA: TIGR01777 family oxidoreductase [Candidatus Didemnitutus sp.]|jgi:hypothetical protein
MRAKIVLAGGNGFLGRSLARNLGQRGYEVVILTRHPGSDPAGCTVFWDGRNPGPWMAEIEGARAVVNLTGRSVNCAPTAANRAEIMSSRVDSVRVLAAAIAAASRPPPVWLQSSSLAIYGNPGDVVCDENAPPADDFSAQVCRQWEAALPAGPARPVILRISLVLAPAGGALGPLARLVRRFLGGSVGPGRQYVSWLHEDDMNAVFVDAIERDDFAGAYNICTPNPVPNAELMRELRRVLRRPWSPPAPTWAVRIAARWFMRTDPELALTGRRCAPARLMTRGFQFRFPELRPALDDLVRRGL